MMMEEEENHFLIPECIVRHAFMPNKLSLDSFICYYTVFHNNYIYIFIVVINYAALCVVLNLRAFFANQQPHLPSLRMNAIIS